jgi:CelD/BcsL family acetyltransferase involved in cellulose biosynthesis
MSSYKVKIAHSMELFHSLAADWRDLLDNSYSNSLFLTWEWLYTWSEVFLGSERKLFILLAYRNNELIGIAPWYLNQIRSGPFRIRKIEFLGSPEASSDYLDLISVKGKEDKVSSLIYDYLVNDINSEWDILHLRDFPANSLHMVRFLNKLERNGKHIEIGNGSYCPTVDLPTEKQIFFDSLSTNRRKKYNRDFRILMGDPDVKHITMENEKGREYLDKIKTLYLKRWEGNHDKFFMFLEKYIERTKKEDMVQIDLLMKSDFLVAGIIHFLYKDTIYNYLLSVDIEYKRTISLGNLFIAMCILNAIEKKFKQYDFLKGDEEYKFHWANNGNRLLNITYYNNSFTTMFSLSKKRIKEVGKIMLR